MACAAWGGRQTATLPECNSPHHVVEPVRGASLFEAARIPKARELLAVAFPTYRTFEVHLRRVGAVTCAMAGVLVLIWVGHMYMESAFHICTLPGCIARMGLCLPYRPGCVPDIALRHRPHTRTLAPSGSHELRTSEFSSSPATHKVLLLVHLPLTKYSHGFVCRVHAQLSAALSNPYHARQLVRCTKTRSVAWVTEGSPRSAVACFAGLLTTFLQARPLTSRPA